MHMQGGFQMTDEPINHTDELIDEFIAECEEQAAKLEITVDYYLAEFLWLLFFLIWDLLLLSLFASAFITWKDTIPIDNKSIIG